MSAGKHDRGEGEQGDVRTALDFLAKEYPGSPLLLAGFSFGCWVGLRVGCGAPRVAELIGLGTPVNASDFSYLLECEKPKLFVQGSEDQFGSIDKLEILVASLPGKNRVCAVEGGDHFFAGKLDQVGLAITDWLTGRHPEILR